jgi:Xaa-Pro aminopeptidase
MTTYIQGKHEYQARRIFSATATDWEERINFERMRKERLARLHKEMETNDLGALVLFQGHNIRYATGTWQGVWKAENFTRYAVVCQGKLPVLFETVGTDIECARIDVPWLGDRIRPAQSWQWMEGEEEDKCQKMVETILEVLSEEGVRNAKIGVDRVDLLTYETMKKLHMNVVSGWSAISRARVIKTRDEIECLKLSAAYGDVALWKLMHEWSVPGVSEADLVAKVSGYLWAEGFDFVPDAIIASGGNTSPYRRWHTDKLIRQGDLVICDLGAAGPGGYCCDMIRTWKVASKPTAQEKDLFKECHDSLHRAIEALKPGSTTADVAKCLPEFDDDKYKSVTLEQFAHSVGLTTHEGMWVSRAFSLAHPVAIEPNMYFAVETIAAHPGLPQTVRLEEDVIVTETGHEFFTLVESPADFFES